MMRSADKQRQKRVMKHSGAAFAVCTRRTQAFTRTVRLTSGNRRSLTLWHRETSQGASSFQSSIALKPAKRASRFEFASQENPSRQLYDKP